jgi:hypothetical protein
VAYWLARLHYNSGRSEEAMRLLEGRRGDHLSECSLQVLEARVRIVLGQADLARGLLETCRREWRLDPERRGHAAVLGLLRFDGGEEISAAEALREAGGDPWAVLDGVMRAHLPRSESLRAVEVLLPVEGTVEVELGGGRWQVDLSTGLARKGETAREVPQLPGEADSSRTEAVPCRGGWAWSSPAEGLNSGRAGVYLWTRSGLETLALSPLPGADGAPTCADGQVFFLRRVLGVGQVMHLEGDSLRGLEFEAVTVASLHARKEARTPLEFLVGAVVEGEPGVFWARLETGEDPIRLEPLFSSGEPAMAPRWVGP